MGGEHGAQRVSSQTEAPPGHVGRLQVQAIVNEFKASTLTIGWRAQEISETLLVRISGKRVYRDLEFEEDQREHRAAVLQKLQRLHQDVVAIMTNSYEVFKNDSPEVWLLGPGSVASQGPPTLPVAVRTFSWFFPSIFWGALLRRPAVILGSLDLQSLKPSFGALRPISLFHWLPPPPPPHRRCLP